MIFDFIYKFKYKKWYSSKTQRVSMKSFRACHILLTLVVYVVINSINAAKYEFGGVPRLDTAFDTHHCVGTDDGATILYPAPPEYDANGFDINAHAHYGMTPALSKFFLKISDCKVKECELRAYIEGDFTGVLDAVGSSMYTIGLFKMRYAYFKATWPKTTLLIGHSDHPFFVPDCTPNTVNYYGGLPMACYTRGTEIRVEHQWRDMFFGLTAYSQFLFVSIGPCGVSGSYTNPCFSRSYMRHAITPEVCASVIVRKPWVTTGILFDVKQLRPALYTVGALDIASTATTVKKYITNQKITSVIGSAVLGFKWENLRINNQITLGQNGPDFGTLGGYAVSCYNPETGACTYTNVNFLGIWTDWEYNKYTSLTPGFFLGLVQSLGASQGVYLRPTTGTPYFYGFDYRLDKVFRFAPRITTKFYNIFVGFEVDYSSAWFGAMDCCGKHPTTCPVSSTRFLLQTHYDF